jgi:hypothetical protein
MGEVVWPHPPGRTARPSWALAQCEGIVAFTGSGSCSVAPAMR